MNGLIEGELTWERWYAMECASMDVEGSCFGLWKVRSLFTRLVLMVNGSQVKGEALISEFTAFQQISSLKEDLPEV